MMYTRKFVISASHFNSQYEYAAYFKIKDSIAQLGEHVDVYADHVQRCLSNIHGHNFEITVTATGDELSFDLWLVDDQVIESMVMEWNNRNLSVHPDFEGRRATTEHMVRVLLWKLRARTRTDINWTVRVQETRDVFAEESSPC